MKIVILIILSILPYGKFENYIPTSTSGDFFVELKYAGACESSKSGKNLIQYNMKSVRTANSRKELQGNITYLIPFDDSIKATMQLEKFSPSTGRFTPNYFRIRLDHVCSDTYRYMGDAWRNFQRMIDMPVGCPIPQGTYIVKEFDINLLFDSKISALPANFFYGRYKLYLTFEKSNEVIGCHLEIVECKPAWQNQKKN